jgi:hypothetical protein
LAALLIALWVYHEVLPGIGFPAQAKQQEVQREKANHQQGNQG